MKIMLVDDEQSMRVLVERIVRGEGFGFCAACDGYEALEMFEKENPDLLILDVMMPGLNGYAVCTRLRERGANIPILFLTAKGDIVDKSIGFQAGCDDYLVKPFLTEELVLRINALLQRNRRSSAHCRVSDEVVYGDIVIDTRRHRVTVRGEVVDLTPKEFQILAILASNMHEVFTREQLIEEVWGNEYQGDPSGITVFIRKIREKIEEDPSDPRYVQTVWRVGYRFGD